MIPLHDFKHQLASFPRNFIGDNQFVIARAKAVLAVSEFTRQEIIDFSAKGTLPPVPEVSAVQLVHECAEGKELSEQTPPNQPYILTVGSMLGRKNLDRVFEAMQLLKRDGKEVPLLVLAGAPRGKTKAYLQTDACAEIRDYVVFYHNPNQTDLVALYEQAMAVIMPSRMEGWGLPAGEALWCGTPVICSTAPVLKEVCGDLGIYFDPDSAEELASSISRVLTDHEFSNDLRIRIAKSKPELRTWGHVAADLRAVLSRISNPV